VLLGLLLLGTSCPPTWEEISVPVQPVDTDTTATRGRIVGMTERIALAYRLAPDSLLFGDHCSPSWARRWSTGIPLLKTGHIIRVCVDSSAPGEVRIRLTDDYGPRRGLRPSADSIRQSLLDSLTRLGAIDRGLRMPAARRGE
jgi:hypothetical protein